jgi:glycosyltransferase involved in cell wall biosynthesis
MRVLLFNYEFNQVVGEAAEACLSLLQENSKNSQLEIDFVTASTDGQSHVLKMGENITIYQIPNSKKLTKPAYQSAKEPFSFVWDAYWFARKLAKQNNYDLCHVYYSETFGRVAMLLKRGFKLPYIVSFQGSDCNGVQESQTILHKLQRPIAKKILSKASFVIANSLWLRELILSTNPDKEVDVIHNGVDRASFFQDGSKRNPEQFRIVCASEITPTTGVRFLIQAFKLLSGRYDQVRLLIVGDGNERKSLEDLAQGLDIKDKVEFVGKVSHEKMPEYYQQSDLLAWPSLKDGISKIILEAMSSGLPVVATQNVWTKEIIENNISGLLVQKSNADDLAEKIEKLITDQGFREKMVSSTLVRAQKLSLETVAAHYMDVYIKTENLQNIRQD